MKKLLFALAILTTIGSSAQVDPLSQFFNNGFIPNIVVFDSITVSADSGSAFTPMATAAQHYFTNGHIDTLVITQFGSPFLNYDGLLSGRTTTITGTIAGSNNYVDRLIFKQDTLFRDSLVEYYAYNSGSFQLFFKAEIFYTSASGNDPDHLDIYADMGSGLTKAGDYTYFYASNRLDSVYYTISMGGNSDGYFKYTYDPTGKLTKMETYEDIDNDGEKDLVQQLLFKHNPLGQIVEITEVAMDQNGNMVLAGAYRYSKRKNSTISLPELGDVTVSLYPNPAYDHLKLEFDKEIFSRYEIISTNGQLMDSGKAMERLDVNHLDRGIYILKLTGDKGSVNTRFNKM